MSVVGEVVGIIACVAAIVSAYKDGREVVHKIRDRRAARQARPPTKLLEASLTEAAQDIETERDRGVSRLGETFNHGDEIALRQLHQIQLELQSELFVQLVQAFQDDDVVDFEVAMNASDLGRDSTITTLIELRQRLVMTRPIARALPQSFTAFTRQTATAATAPPRRQTIQNLPVDSLKTWPPQRIQYPSMEGLTISSSQNTFDSQSPPPLSPISSSSERRRSSSSRADSFAYFPWSISFRRKSGGKQRAVEEVMEERPASAEPVQARRRNSDSYFAERNGENSGRQPYSMPIEEEEEEEVKRSDFGYSGGHDNLAQIWGSSYAVTTAAAAAVTKVPYAPDTVGLADPSIVPQGMPTELVLPTSQNNYLGFCKGAWKMQNNEAGAFKKKLEFNSGWSQSQVPYLGCSSSKCVFAGRIPEERMHKQVWHSNKGINVRWGFLAKSHVEQSKAVDECYGYLCMFCALTGAKTRVWFGVDTLLGHLARHRGELLPLAVLQRANCIVDRVAGDDEDFDVNLRPLGKEPMAVGDASMFGEDSNPWA